MKHLKKYENFKLNEDIDISSFINNIEEEAKKDNIKVTIKSNTLKKYSGGVSNLKTENDLDINDTGGGNVFLSMLNDNNGENKKYLEQIKKHFGTGELKIQNYGNINFISLEIWIKNVKNNNDN